MKKYILVLRNIEKEKKKKKNIYRDIADPAASIRLLRFHKPKNDDANSAHRQALILFFSHVPHTNIQFCCCFCYNFAHIFFFFFFPWQWENYQADTAIA